MISVQRQVSDPFVQIGVQTLFFSGFNPDVDSMSTPEDIWPIGGLIVFASAAGPVSVVSDSANDASAGTGAQQAVLFGVDDNFEELDEIVVMGGLTPVLTTKNFLHVQTASIIAAGTSGGNEGIITFTIGGGVVNAMAIGKAQTQSCARIIPVSAIRGTEAHLLNVFALAGKQQTSEATIVLITTSSVSGVSREALDVPITTAGGAFNLDIKVPITFETGSRVLCRVEDVSANDTLVAAGLQFAWLQRR